MKIQNNNVKIRNIAKLILRMEHLMKEKLMIIMSLMGLVLFFIHKIRYAILAIGKITNFMGLDIYLIIHLKNKSINKQIRIFACLIKISIC